MNVTTQSSNDNVCVTNIAIRAGETVALALSLSNSDSSALNLAGYSLKCQIAFPAPLLLTTGNSGIAITNAASGAVQINIPSATSAGFLPGSYPYDFEWIFPR